MLKEGRLRMGRSRGDLMGKNNECLSPCPDRRVGIEQRGKSSRMRRSIERRELIKDTAVTLPFAENGMPACVTIITGLTANDELETHSYC